MPDESPKRKDTDFLNLPPSEEVVGRSEPIPPPASSAGSVTTEFTLTSRLQLKIENTKLTLAVTDRELVVGRTVEGDEYSGIDIDLTP